MLDGKLKEILDKQEADLSEMKQVEFFQFHMTLGDNTYQFEFCLN